MMKVETLYVGSAEGGGGEIPGSGWREKEEKPERKGDT